MLRAAVLVGEDEDFFAHGGVDWWAGLRALADNLRCGRVVSGASTLTMQVVRIVEPRPRTLWSKLLEIVRARQLERCLGKAQIASVWLEQVPLGGTLRGFEAGARQWFGPWTVTPNQREKGALADSYRVHGHTTEGYLRALPRAEVTAIVLEYGTYPPQDSLPVMLEDHWLTLHGDETIEAGREIKQRMLRLHYPQDPDWRQAVWDRSQQVVAQAVRGLTAA